MSSSKALWRSSRTSWSGKTTVTFGELWLLCARRLTSRWSHVKRLPPFVFCSLISLRTGFGTSVLLTLHASDESDENGASVDGSPLFLHPHYAPPILARHPPFGGLWIASFGGLRVRRLGKVGAAIELRHHRLKQAEAERHFLKERLRVWDQHEARVPLPEVSQSSVEVE